MPDDPPPFFSSKNEQHGALISPSAAPPAPKEVTYNRANRRWPLIAMIVAALTVAAISWIVARLL
jgi:hypothetical protein